MLRPMHQRKIFFAARWLAAYFVALGVNTRQSSTELTTGERQMTTAEQTAKRTGGQGGVAPAFDDHDCLLGDQAAIPGRPDAVSYVMVKKLMGKKCRAAGWVLGMCNADPQFLVHLAEQPRGYVHFLCLIRMALAEWETGNGNAQDDARMLRAGDKRKLLKELFPSCPPGIVNLLPKLPKKPLPKDAYQKLICALEDESVRKGLYRMKRIKKPSMFMLDEIAHFPEQFRSVAMRCVKDADGYAALWRTIRVIERFDLKVTEQELVCYDWQTTAPDGISDWLMKKISRLPFPPPPWDGDDKIRPIRSLHELEKVAEKFRNLLTNSSRRRYYVSRILAGYGYIYVCDHTPAVIEVEREIFWGWTVQNVTGVENAEPASNQTNEIKRKFIKAGILPETGPRYCFFNDDILF